MLNALLAVSFDAVKVVEIVIVALSVLIALTVIVVVLIQPSNSNGASALSGRTADTFYGKNKGKSMESKLKIVTVVFLVLLAVLMISYFLIEIFRSAIIG